MALCGSVCYQTVVGTYHNQVFHKFILTLLSNPWVESQALRSLPGAARVRCRVMSTQGLSVWVSCSCSTRWHGRSVCILIPQLMWSSRYCKWYEQLIVKLCSHNSLTPKYIDRKYIAGAKQRLSEWVNRNDNLMHSIQWKELFSFNDWLTSLTSLTCTALTLTINRDRSLCPSWLMPSCIAKKTLSFIKDDT